MWANTDAHAQAYANADPTTVGGVTVTIGVPSAALVPARYWHVHGTQHVKGRPTGRARGRAWVVVCVRLSASEPTGL